MIRAMINRGEWANQLRRLSEATRKSLEETIRAQAKLVVMDCVKATPPFTPGKNWTESLNAQRKVGQQAVQRDLARVFREAGGYKRLTDGRTARRIAKLVMRGDEAKAVNELRFAGINVQGIERRPTKSLWDHQRNKRGQVPFRRDQSFLVHDGQVPSFLAAPLSASNRPNDPILAEMLDDQMARVGNAKAGWAKGCEALGAKLPKWITKQRGYTSGRVNIQGQGVKFSVEVNNGVPYIQETGRELQIINWALKNRARNIEKQIRMTLRKNKVTS